MGKVESFSKRLRWKVCFYEKHDDNDSEYNNNNYEFKSSYTPTQNEHLNELKML